MQMPVSHVEIDILSDKARDVLFPLFGYLVDQGQISLREGGSVHDNEVVNLSIDKVGTMNMGDSEVQPKGTNLPAILAASEEWKKAKETGLVDENNQPTGSRPEAALIADMLSVRLGIAHKWKLFEGLWHRNNMRSDFNTALEQRKSLRFQERLKNILD